MSFPKDAKRSGNDQENNNIGNGIVKANGKPLLGPSLQHSGSVESPSMTGYVQALTNITDQTSWFLPTL